MKKSILAFCLVFLPMVALADDDKGAFVGAGAAVTLGGDCGSDCDTSGYVLEAGYNFNKIIGIEVKRSVTDYEHYEGDELELSYIGLNIGHTFNSSWIRFYGKIGYVNAKDSETSYLKDYFNGEYTYYTDGESYSDKGPAFGLGVSFIPFAHQRGFYIKLETMNSQLFENSIGYGQLTVGYQF